MKNRLYYILFFLLSAVVLHAQQADTASSKDFDFDQAMDDLTDLELFADALAARYAIKVSNTGKTANMPLYEFIDAFLARTSVHVGIQQNLKSENPFGSFFDVRRMRGNYTEGQGQHGLIFSIGFIQQKDNPRFYKILVDIKKIYTESASRIDKDNCPKFDAYIDTINNSTQTYARADFKNTINEFISKGLFILLGIESYPLSVDIQPDTARGIDRITNAKYEEILYEKIIVSGKPKPVTNVSLKQNDVLSFKTLVSRMEIDSIEKPVRISNGKNFNQTLSSFDSVKNFAYTATITGDDAITATYDLKFEDKTITETAGKLNVSVYQEEKFKVKIVPINNVGSIDEQSLKTFLNAVYNQAVAVWEDVTVEPNLTVSKFDDRLNTETGNFSNYSSEMNSIISAYKNSGRTVEKGVYYIFVVAEFEDYQISGFMPLKRNYGFVSYRNRPESLGRLIAHELGHGTFRLNHTFNDNPASRGATNNLMDYVNAMPDGCTELCISKLYKYQWDYIHNPEGGIYWFQDEEDVMARENRVPEIINTIRAAKEEEQELSLISGTLYTSEHTKIGDVEYKDIAIQVKKRGEQIVINKVKVHSIDTSDQQSGSHFDINVRDQNSGVSNPWYITITLRSREERRKLLGYLQERTVIKPQPGDPLINMEIQGTNKNNPNNRIGGMYGCTRYISEQRTQCQEWAKKIDNFPSVNGKNKVHDGLDLKAPTNTPVYAMYKGTVTSAGYSETLGYFVLIQSTKTEHNILTETNTISISYGHLSSFENGLIGKKVEQGMLIGYTGNSGVIAQNIGIWQYHLHLTVYNGSTANKYNRVNPINYITTKFDQNGNKK